MRSFLPWKWVPSLYFSEGVPYAIIASVSVILLKDLQMSNRELAFLTSLLTLPWVLKPLWAPLIDLIWTKKIWFIAMDLLMGAGFIACGGMLPLCNGSLILILILIALAIASATHDAAADGFYLLGLASHEQAYFTGIRSTAYRIAMVTAQGGLVMLVGFLQNKGCAVRQAWAGGLAGAGGMMALLGMWHIFSVPAVEKAADRPTFCGLICEFGTSFAAFFRQKNVVYALLFLLFYRFGESQLVRLAVPFMQDVRNKGGLGLSVQDIGLFYGTVGVICLLAGGILGGWLISRDGVGKWLWPMALAINIPDFVYVYLATAHPDNRWLAGGAVAVEQFGYGFGFTLYMIFMVAFAGQSGKFKTAHFALMTGFMALGMMLPGMAAGAIYDWLGGYVNFFWYVIACTLPGFAVSALVPRMIGADFGKKMPN